MYCRACLDIFRVYHRRIVQASEPAPHQLSVGAVHRSSSNGCVICSHLWEQLQTYRLEKGRDCYSQLSSFYCAEPILDQINWTSGAGETDPSNETLLPSRLAYYVEFYWKGLAEDPLAGIQYWLLATEKLSKPLYDHVPSKCTDSAASWGLQKRWIEDCLEKHPGCSTAFKDWMPTRILDVGCDGSSEWRLVESRTQQSCHSYMTLSHCWGKVGALKLTKSTIDSMRRGLPISKLPNLYQDAVTACRQLGTQYLWIDSLCIIQDDEDDWIREIATMGDVYKNSLCNIEASHAADGNGRLFYSRSEKHIKTVPITVEWLENGPLTCFLFDCSSFRDTEMADAPLLERAWVLQEQLLAARTLTFGPNQVHWICRTREASEMFPSGAPDIHECRDLLSHSLTPRPLLYLKGWITSDSYSFFGYENRWPASPNMSPWEDFCLMWRTVVLDYTRRSLTLPKDKLAAIAGLASMVQRKTKTQYLAGMWNFRFTIEYELCWTPIKQANGHAPYRPAEYRAPTWSWASIEGSVYYQYQKDHDISGDSRLAFVEDAAIETIDGTTTGPVKSGWIQVSGPLSEAKLHGVFDADDEADKGTGPVFYLAMFSLYLDNRIWGLALRRLKSTTNEACYARIGTFDFYDEHLFEEMEKAKVQLVTIV